MGLRLLRLDSVKLGPTCIRLSSRSNARRGRHGQGEDYEGAQITCVRSSRQFALLLYHYGVLVCVTESSAVCPSAHVIHAVGPIYEPDEKDLVEKQLRSCYDASLDLAVEHSVGSIVRALVLTLF